MRSCSVVCRRPLLVVKISHSFMSLTSNLTNTFNCFSALCIVKVIVTPFPYHCGVFACKKAKNVSTLFFYSQRMASTQVVKGLVDFKMAWGWNVNGARVCVKKLRQSALITGGDDLFMWYKHWEVFIDSMHNSVCFLNDKLKQPFNHYDDRIIMWPADCIGWVEYHWLASCGTTASNTSHLPLSLSAVIIKLNCYFPAIDLLL